jgi:CAAX protease family protein
LVGGVLLGFAMFAAVYAVLWATGHAQWLGFAGADHVARLAAAAAVAGICEELVVRGGVFRIVEDMFGTTVALAVSCLLFGAMHLANPHITWFVAATIALEAGLLLAAAYAASRNLWLPIGIHIGWNFTEGGVFGAAVSGNAGGHGLVKMPLHGPDLLTGGLFGPEASVVALAICLAVGVCFIMQTLKRGRWVAASFHMMLD